MAAPTHGHNAVSQDTLITIKVSVNDSIKKLKLPLRDLGANVLPDKLRQQLNIKPEQTVVFERFSDSAGGYIVLDTANPQVFKTLVRAAKAKLKLRLKATVTPVAGEEKVEAQETSATQSTRTAEPVIVRSPLCQSGNGPRGSMAVDRRSVGSGIFEFREGRNSQQTLVNIDEAPVPKPFNAGQKNFFDGLALRGRDSVPTFHVHGNPWSVYCNECDAQMLNLHFHCGICDGGDFDLCEKCVASGKLCPGQGHWLIKRTIEDGKVITSTTERISPRIPAVVDVPVAKVMPGAFADDVKSLLQERPQTPSRTCNSCVVVLPEREFVTCVSCDDFDLCVDCVANNKHGHHPAHGFTPATKDTTLAPRAEVMLAPGRNSRHNAICDGCDKKIYGVRHKCLNCPDWDFCNDCVKDAPRKHPRHRFAALYQPIADQHQPTVQHFGISCDGPLCVDKARQSYITGVRYKCAVCNDTDFCASCEAFPGNHHNRTHPLIKFKTPVRNVSITTENCDARGQVRLMGDRRAEPAQSAVVAETAPMNAPIPVQTVAEIKPTQVTQEAKPIPIVEATKQPAPVASEKVPSALLNAHFVADSVSDGTTVQAGARFTQIWTLKNPGPFSWPAGCSVRYIGGDNMLNVSNGHPASVSDITEASESNVVAREVEVGEDVAFKVVLKAPTRVGKAISYWRLKAADGTPFGHRLWCDVDVKEANAPSFPAQVPAPYPLSDLASEEIAFLTREARQMALAQQMRIADTQASAQQQAFNQLQEQQFLQRQQLIQQRLKQRQAEQQLAAAAAHHGSFPDHKDRVAAQLAARRESAGFGTYPTAPWTHRVPMVPQFGFPNGPSAATPNANAAAQDQARKEAAKHRVEYIKAKIMRTREERARLREQQLRAVADLPAAMTPRADVVESKQQAEAVTPTAEPKQEEEEDLEGSQMVFPKLEKESPASSTYQSATLAPSEASSSTSKAKAAYVENEQGEVERSASPAPSSQSAPVAEPIVVSSPTPTTVTAAALDDGYDDLTDELEVLSADDDGVSDDGFLTDEEYDILDASDSETVASK